MSAAPLEGWCRFRFATLSYTRCIYGTRARETDSPSVSLVLGSLEYRPFDDSNANRLRHGREFKHTQIWFFVQMQNPKSWAMVMRRAFWSKFSKFGTNFAATCFRPKISEKIAWHEPNNMPTSSATSLIVIRRFSITIFFTASVFSLVVDVLGRPGRASSFTSSRPSVKSLYHL